MHTCALVRLQLVVTSYSSGMQSQCNKQIHATHTHRQLTRGLYNALLDALRTVHFSHVSSL